MNFDTYFDAPSEAPECASDIPEVPPGTAKTSPYEYLTTAVYPACARFGGPPPPEAVCGRNTQPAPPPFQDPNWNSDCTNGMCYGVPLYRQGLTSQEQQPGREQSIRMMGANLWQRSTLTANNGVYYIDTAAGPWAGKDVDWPDGGAYAFGLKFPSTFAVDDQDHRPAPRCLRQRTRAGTRR